MEQKQQTSGAVSDVRSSGWLADDAARAYGEPKTEWLYACDYQPIIDSIGKVAVQVEDNECQGDTRILFERGDDVGHIVFGWGSCSGCNALQGCGSWQEVADLRNQLAAQVMWRSVSEMAEWFKAHDWEGDYSFRQVEMLKYRSECEAWLAAKSANEAAEPRDQQNNESKGN